MPMRGFVIRGLGVRVPLPANQFSFKIQRLPTDKCSSAHGDGATLQVFLRRLHVVCYLITADSIPRAFKEAAIQCDGRISISVGNLAEDEGVQAMMKQVMPPTEWDTGRRTGSDRSDLSVCERG
jgi:hypothetical protein